MPGWPVQPSVDRLGSVVDPAAQAHAGAPERGSFPLSFGFRSSRTSRRTVAEAASRAITAGSSSQGVSTMAGPARRTSSTATSSGVSEWSSRSIGRWVKRTPGQGPGVRPGTAARNVAGTCDVRPSQFAAATPAGPEPRPPSWRATSSILGGDMPRSVHSRRALRCDVRVAAARSRGDE